jgi:hypothetical protein
MLARTRLRPCTKPTGPKHSHGVTLLPNVADGPTPVRYNFHPFSSHRQVVLPDWSPGLAHCLLCGPPVSPSGSSRSPLRFSERVVTVGHNSLHHLVTGEAPFWWVRLDPYLCQIPAIAHSTGCSSPCYRPKVRQAEIPASCSFFLLHNAASLSSVRALHAL